MELLLQILWSSIGVLIAVAYGLLTGGIVRKLFARIQGRVGPPVYQGFIDLGKNFFVRDNISHGPMFYFGPALRTAGGVGIFLFIPAIVGWAPGENFSFAGDLLLVMYFMFFGSLGMALGGSAGGHPHTPIGAGRGLSQMTAFEVPFILAVIALVADTGSFSVHDLTLAQAGGFLEWNLLTHPFAAAAAFIAMLGMNGYAPFNVVGAPNEIPVGPMTEYQGGFIATLGTGRAIFAIAKMILFMDLFLGGATSILEAFIKVFVIYMWSVAVAAVFPRYRVDQSMRFFLGWPALIGVVAVLLALF
ncbi:MAG: NADH-quinone oxidoreductase subunit H [Deltaproteobacteria bacterium]|nr:NADH-quinone oxidoreductase subunit H [Deltaproteobacteria bacterium]